MNSTMDKKILLDTKSVQPEELSLDALMHEISLQKRPNKVLRKMMTALEGKRQKKGFGWSRAWNKYGMNNFRAHTCDIKNDLVYLKPAVELLKNNSSSLPVESSEFVDDLLGDPRLMVFTFYHNAEYDGVQYEGVTLSFGRKIVDDKTKRDRIDIVLEDKRVNGEVDGKVDRVRIYTCPWSKYAQKEFHLEERELTENGDGEMQALYEHAVSYYHRWKTEEERLWNHWSIRYIEYFGPRSFIPVGSSFT